MHQMPPINKMQNQNSNLLAVDVGEKRIGLAVASSVARLPRPLTTIPYNDASIAVISQTAEKEAAGTIVVGLPLNSYGKPTQQTQFTEAFIEKLRTAVSAEVETCDETLSSKRAEKELRQRKKPFTKGDIDALAAAYILEDYLREKGEL